jgi:hypothetical protein
MKIDLTQELKTFDGVPMRLSEEDDSPVTLKFVVADALLTQLPDDSTTKGLAYRLYTLAHLVNKGGEVDIEAGDVEMIKERIERIRSPMVVGQSWDMLEGRSEPVAAPDSAPSSRPRGRR